MSKNEFELITGEYNMQFDEEIEYMYKDKGEYVYSWNGVTIYYGDSKSVKIGGFIPLEVAEEVCEKYPQHIIDASLTLDSNGLNYCKIENKDAFSEFLSQLSDFYGEKSKAMVKKIGG